MYNSKSCIHEGEASLALFSGGTISISFPPDQFDGIKIKWTPKVGWNNAGARRPSASQVKHTSFANAFKAARKNSLDSERKPTPVRKKSKRSELLSKALGINHTPSDTFYKKLDGGLTEDEIREHYYLHDNFLPPAEPGHLPADLMERWVAAFGNSLRPKMSGYRAKTLEGRIDIAKELIYLKEEFDIDPSLCDCGCGCVYECGNLEY